MIKADFVTGLIFVALGLGALAESLRMPRFETLSVNPYTVPGIVPGMLGAVIAVLGLLLALRSARAGGWRLGGEVARLVALRRSGAARRFLLAFVLTVGYAAGLIGTVPFWLATGVFVFVFIAAFEWPAAEDRGRRRRVLALAAVEAALVTIAVTLVFQEVFLVRLP
ncbi:MAG: tripartite tricarboxylate transporter TctB family protein [Alphaproteobacteria bacterium]|jgi:putative tricarboxylic transport membrane protein|nr:tripartite tricarboxylate transporter TctB family protein [Alphaproteobacteria bacterium]